MGGPDGIPHLVCLRSMLSNRQGCYGAAMLDRIEGGRIGLFFLFILLFWKGNHAPFVNSYTWGESLTVLVGGCGRESFQIRNSTLAR